jgi:hypothetical protein
LAIVLGPDVICRTLITRLHGKSNSSINVRLSIPLL